ncbi:hypothetical protein [Pedobacter sp. SL55]|uniref:hypothetical protein n=1 Tax=Pedobacter sp. SL55 TaxID=2995161 RepID=UPI00226E9A3F|nr:hypothetical protein [Pedobacter sp. SL55]WAC39565.1 hypothetical protein OVA16_13335 [Pedobacter sp. SL55]
MKTNQLIAVAICNQTGCSKAIAKKNPNTSYLFIKTYNLPNHLFNELGRNYA